METMRFSSWPHALLRLDYLRETSYMVHYGLFEYAVMIMKSISPFIVIVMSIAL